MIARHWRGLAKPERADDYVRHLSTETLPKLSTIPGFVSASILKRTLAQGVEFLVMTNWDSVAAIERFAGPDAELAVVPAVAHEMMLDYDRRARHYEVLT